MADEKNKGGKSKGAAPNPPPGEASSLVLNFRVSPWLGALLNKVAAETGLSRHEVARRLIRAKIKEIGDDYSILIKPIAAKEPEDIEPAHLSLS